jgi:ABC-type molybdate transport system ATPase subunit
VGVKPMINKADGSIGLSKVEPFLLADVSIVTKAAVENLGLKEGKEVYAVINATDVILATDY